MTELEVVACLCGWEDARLSTVRSAETLAGEVKAIGKGVGPRARRLVPARGAPACTDLRPALRVLRRGAMPTGAWHGGGWILATILLDAVTCGAPWQRNSLMCAPRTPTSAAHASSSPPCTPRARASARARPSSTACATRAACVAHYLMPSAQPVQTTNAGVLRRSFSGTLI